MFLELRILFVIVEIQEIMKVVYFSVANTVSYPKHAYFDVTPLTLTVKNIHKDEILGSQDVLQFFSGESMQD